MRKIYMIGDSIMQTNKFATFPQTGWGQVLSLFIHDDVEVINLAKNGTSTKSFIDQNRFKFVEDNIQKDDLLIVGFAHNDEKTQDPLRYTSPSGEFKDNLRYFINVAKSKGARVILSTPVVRRNFVDGKLIETHGNYVSSIIECAKENIVNFVDLNKLTYNVVSNLGDLESKKIYMNFQKDLHENYPYGCEDNSHLNYYGAVLIAKLFVKELFDRNYEEKLYFLELPSSIICASDTYEK